MFIDIRQVPISKEHIYGIKENVDVKTASDDYE